MPMPISIRPGIDWVGYTDWHVRDFHGYVTERGATYNAYLLRDTKTALIDTVKGPFAGDLLARVGQLYDPASVDYVICNHAEPDHSSALPQIMAAMPKATLVCSAKCVPILQAYYDTAGWNIRTVGSGDTLALGKWTLSFLEVPMVHWPDSMMTYLADEKILFSNDAFGQHYASSLKFDDQVPLAEVMDEARVYYANIVNPYNRRVQAVLQAAGTLAIDTICPSHGVIWRRHVGEILKGYQNWAWNRSQAKVVIAYDTMWNSTGLMAEALAEGAGNAGIDVRLINVRGSSNTRIVTELIDAAAIALGSSTLNQKMLPAMAGIVNYIQGLNFLNRAACAFGSCGWGRGGAEELVAKIKEMNWELLDELPLKAKYRPTAADLQACRTMGERLAARAIQMAAESGYQKLVID